MALHLPMKIDVSMVGRFAVGAILMCAFTATAIAATEIWEKPFSAWTERDVRKIVTDSPWAGTGRIRYLAMNGANAAPIHRRADVLWSSAAPIRHALSREPDGLWGAPLGREHAVPVYTVTMRLSDTPSLGPAGSQMRMRSVSAMQAGTFLLRKGKPPLKAVEADAWEYRENPRGRGSMVVFYVFPASDAIVLDDREVTFVTKTCGTGWAPGTLRQDCMYDIRKTFLLRNMVVGGKLAL